MKKCPKCGMKHKDRVNKCQYCNSELVEYNISENKSTLIKWYESRNDEQKKKYLIILIVLFALICYTLGILSHMAVGVKKKDYRTVISNYSTLKKEVDSITEEYGAYKEKMQPYEEQQAADVKAEEEKLKAEQAAKEAEEKAKQEAEAAAKAKAAKEAKEKAETKKAQDTSTSKSGIIPKDYKPVGKEPNWIAIVSYCESQMPKVIGYDASISLDGNDTKVVRTGLRYKVETDMLKIKADKSYHKGIFIIEFENENYETYSVVTAEVDGLKIR